MDDECEDDDVEEDEDNDDDDDDDEEEVDDKLVAGVPAHCDSSLINLSIQTRLLVPPFFDIFAHEKTLLLYFSLAHHSIHSFFAP